MLLPAPDEREIRAVDMLPREAVVARGFSARGGQDAHYAIFRSH